MCVGGGWGGSDFALPPVTASKQLHNSIVLQSGHSWILSFTWPLCIVISALSMVHDAMCLRASSSIYMLGVC
jgi:hypothetical protein